MHKLEEFINDRFTEIICVMAVLWLCLVAYGFVMS